MATTEHYQLAGHTLRKALILKLVSRCYNAGYEYAPQRHHQSEREGDDCHVLERPHEAPGLRMRNLDTSPLIGDG